MKITTLTGIEFPLKFKTLCVGLLATLLASTSFAQIPFLKKSIDTSFIPETAVLAAVVRPSELAEKEEFDLFPREIVTAYGLKNFGFDPMKVQQATILVENPEGMMRPPAYGFVVRFKELQGVADNVLDAREQKQVGEYTLYLSDSPAEPSYLVIDEVTVLVGDGEFIQSMAQGKGNDQLVKMMKSPAVNGNAYAFIDFTIAKPMLQQMASQLPPMLPPQIRNLKDLPELLIGAELAIKFNIDLETHLKLHTVQEEDAQKAQKIIQEAIDFGRQMMVGSMMNPNAQDPVSQAANKYAQRISSLYGETLTPEVTDNSLSIALKNQESLGPLLIGLVLPAAQQARSAARRTQSMNNVRQLTIAMHNIADATGKGFPAQANYDKNGKPLLSWRVHMLPYLDQRELYDQFHLDEPWNSPHNRTLIDKIPPLYISPAVGDLGGKTVYLGNATSGGVFGKKQLPISNIPNLSQTIAIVEVNESLAVEWTRPSDFEYNPNQPFGGLGGTYPGGFNAAMTDGSVHFISGTLDPKQWKNLLLLNKDQ